VALRGGRVLINLKGETMFLILAIVLVLAWLGLFVGLHVTSFFIHLLIVCAVISLVMHLIGGNKASA